MAKLEKNWLEWCVFGMSSVLVLAIVGYLVYSVATSTNSPPMIEVRLGAAEPREGEFAVPVTVFNHGEQAAETVLIEVRASKLGDNRGGRAQVQIQLLPGSGTRKGWVTFEGTVEEAGEITARAVGFENP
jgi:uncharacterized protein (TIGR02588 family)